MDKTLDALLERRAGERLAARVIPERAAEFRHERKQSPTPEPVKVETGRAEVATEKEAKYTPAPSVPSVGPGNFTSRTAVREGMAARTRTGQDDARAAQAGAAVFADGMSKIDPLERLLAKKLLERNADRPGPKVALGLTRDIER